MNSYSAFGDRDGDWEGLLIYHFLFMLDNYFLNKYVEMSNPLPQPKPTLLQRSRAFPNTSIFILWNF